MQGVSKEVLEIQESFLKFELTYRGTQSIYDKIYEITKTVKKAKLESINEQTYEIAELMLDMGERYLQTELKLNESKSTASTLNNIIKQDILRMISENSKMLAAIEVRLSTLIETLVGESVLSKKEAQRILDEDKKGFIYVSKYEEVENIEIGNLLLKSIVKGYLIQLPLIIILMWSLTSGFINKIMLNITGYMVESASRGSSMGETVPMDVPGLQGVIEILIKITTSVAGITMMVLTILLVARFILDVLYLALPKESEKVLDKIFGEYGTRMKSHRSGVEKEVSKIKVEKQRLKRAQEILKEIEKIEDYKGSNAVKVLKDQLKYRELDSVLSIEDTYAIILVEKIYTIINSNHTRNEEVIKYALGELNEVSTHERLGTQLIQVRVLQTRLGV